jgi:DNA-binding GntR family transcriptional regulator
LTEESLSSLDRSTLRERTVEALRSAITSGVYGPGDRLHEDELATHLKVSNATVRQALRHLQQEGLVTTPARSVRQVASLSPIEVRELFRVRAALEGLAVRRIIALPDRERVLDILRETLTQPAAAEMTFARRVDADLGFHLQLCRLSGNSMLVETWRYLEGRIRIVLMSAGPERAVGIMSQVQHELILDAIENGDLPTAAAVVDDHMATAADHVAASPAG